MFPRSSTALADEKLHYSHLLQASEDGSQSTHSLEDTDTHYLPLQATKHRTLKRFSTLLLLLTLSSLAVFGLLNIGSRQISLSVTTLKPKARSCNCGGTTVAEAKRRGCIFTPMAIAWLPPHCIDMELSDAFDAAGPGGKWEYWYDINATIPMTREQMGMLADDFGSVMYTTQEWHIMHCM